MKSIRTWYRDRKEIHEVLLEVSKVERRHFQGLRCAYLIIQTADGKGQFPEYPLSSPENIWELAERIYKVEERLEPMIKNQMGIQKHKPRPNSGWIIDHQLRCKGVCF